MKARGLKAHHGLKARKPKRIKPVKAKHPTIKKPTGHHAKAKTKP